MLILVLFVAGILLTTKPSVNDDYLDKDRTFCVRGIMMVAIGLSHILPYSNGGDPLRILFPATVAPFFFYSGYGMALKAEKSYVPGAKNSYFRFFFRRRLSRIVCTCAIINSVVVLMRYLNGVYTEYEGAVRDFLHLGWFTTALIVFYIGFYVIYRQKLLDDYKYNILAMCIFIVCYIIVCRYIGKSSYWYGNSFAFPLGTAWAHYKDDIDRIIQKYYLLLLCGCVILLMACTGIIFMREMNIIPYAGPGMLAAFAIGIVYPLFWNLLLCKVEFRTRIWYLIGTISFELYQIERLSHPSAEWITNKMGLTGVEVYAVVALAIAVIYAAVVYQLSIRLQSIIISGNTG